jgi:hypothetical protein
MILFLGKRNALAPWQHERHLPKGVAAADTMAAPAAARSRRAIATRERHDA